MGFWTTILVGVLSIIGWLSISCFVSKSEEYDKQNLSE